MKEATRLIYINKEDFFEKAAAARRISKDEERELSVRMAAGDAKAREIIIDGYLHFVASYIRRMLGDRATLEVVYCCLSALESAVDTFNFLQEGDTFGHQLGLKLKKAINGYIADC